MMLEPHNGLTAGAGLLGYAVRCDTFFTTV
jgi:hypothetical protein